MRIIITALLFVLHLTYAYAQGDSQPSFDFGNSLAGAAVGLDTSSINAVLAFERIQEIADEHYKAERYKRAFEAYLQLAQHNDKFSQYRIAYMYSKGRGVEKAMPNAYAWSRLAAEDGQKDFVNYHVKVRNKMAESEHQQGVSLFKEYINDYGTYTMASKARRLIRAEKRNCSGSRLGNKCDRVQASGQNCGLSSQGQLGKNCLILGSIGLPSVSGLAPADLRKVERQLSVIIDEYKPGTVSLRELELIED